MCYYVELEQRDIYRFLVNSEPLNACRFRDYYYYYYYYYYYVVVVVVVVVVLVVFLERSDYLSTESVYIKFVGHNLKVS
jgi:hypothetical protein